LPGDPAIFKAGPGATDAQVEQVRHDLGLDKPIPVQYGIWLKKMATLDFGVSLGFNTPVSELVRNRLPVTLVVLFYSLILSLIIAIPLGVFSAYRSGSAFDRTSSTVAFGLLSVPPYIIGVVLLYFFAVKWGGSRPSPKTSAFSRTRASTSGYGLPVITLTVAQIAIYMRLLRTDMLATLQMDFITMAREGHVHSTHPLPPRVAAIALLLDHRRRNGDLVVRRDRLAAADLRSQRHWSAHGQSHRPP
jgi:peptide/nickel transport system permease protein